MDVANNKRRRPLSFAGQTLEVECPACGGTGNDGKARFFLDLLGGQFCDTCVGKGYILNDNGRVICDLILYHMSATDNGLFMRERKA